MRGQTDAAELARQYGGVRGARTASGEQADCGLESGDVAGLGVLPDQHHRLTGGDQGGGTLAIEGDAAGSDAAAGHGGACQEL
jgi:hypothetical protein